MTSHNNLISSIIQKKLCEEVDQILSISRQGFDVFARVDFPEVKFSLIQALDQESKINSREFRIFECKRELHADQNKITDDEENFIPTVIVGDIKPESRFGFIYYQVSSPDKLIGNVACAIELILTHYKLDFYIDVFDSKKLSRLKQISRSQGILGLINAVVHTAFYCGYRGDDEAAQLYLDSAEFLTDISNLEETVSLENCAKKFLSHALTYGESAHSFLKSCLSYYVVSKQGHTMTRASQILNISRTTLQEHLKIASHLGVSSFMEGTIIKNSL